MRVFSAKLLGVIELQRGDGRDVGARLRKHRAVPVVAAHPIEVPGVAPRPRRVETKDRPEDRPGASNGRQVDRP